MTDPRQSPLPPERRACIVCNRLVTPHYVKPLDERGVCDDERCRQVMDQHMQMMEPNRD